MNKRLLLKLLPVAIFVAIGLVWAATAPPSANATVSGINPPSFVVTPGIPSSFTFDADAGSTAISASVSSLAPAVLGASCTGCNVSGTGTASLSIAPPTGSGRFTVSLTLNVACAGQGAPVNLTVSQGNTSFSSGVVGVCGGGCGSVLTTACGCGGVVSSVCGCGTVVSTICGCGGTVLSTACGCGAYSSLCGGCGVYTSLCGGGCGTVAYGGIASNCGCVGGAYGTSTVVTGGYNGYLNNGYPYGALTNGYPYGALNNGYPYGALNNGYPYGALNNGYPYGALNNGYPYGALNNGYPYGALNNGYPYGALNNGYANNNCSSISQVSVTLPGSGSCGSSSNVLVTVRNSLGGVANDGASISLSSTQGTISPTVTQTAGGIASATLLLPVNASGSAVVTATVGGVSGQASMAVNCTVRPQPVAVAPIVAPPIISAPVTIVGPNTGDGGCIADPESCTY